MQWRLALSGALVATVVSLGVAAIVGYYFGLAHFGAFLYGAGVGLVSFSSIAVTAWLLGGGFSGERMLLGMAIYVGRLVLAALAVGVPLFLGSWPAAPLVCGFVGVYVVENVALLVGASRMAGSMSTVRSERTGAERRSGV